ncbi:ketopantoate reductase family protein [Paenibacillus thalictri]|uniref:2-dehydropantoate 2-reductase n=1 Tax=Paenibacillus thalictri TaxID=2527873 RepID=A0A4Q9DSS3_9BACL|nr:2-dehydropantoate 2-reductase [Paenibacillus thalictri]TBL78134.1 2-dehydropantoate 2-reductase [Paenibacillus thalictri]
MKIRIVGAGSLGMLFAGRLEVILPGTEIVAHTESQAQRLQSGGIRVIEPHGGSLQAFPEAIAFQDVILEKPDYELDYVLLTVKQSHITPQLAASIGRQLTEKSCVVCFQNGIGHVELLSEYIPAERILIAITTEAAYKRSDSEVEHTGRGTTLIGSPEAAGSDTSEFRENAQKKLIAALNDAGFSVSMSNNILSTIWHKLIVNSVINPLTAILKVRNGELPQQPYSESLMKELLQEASQLASLKHIQPPGPTWEQLLGVCAQTALNRSSMLQDLSAGRLTEIDSITGSLLKEAKRYAHPMPVHETVYRIVKSLEAPH